MPTTRFFCPEIFHRISGRCRFGAIGLYRGTDRRNGTANRSKKFHDVCWKNLKDGGFPDRIAWMKAAAAKYPEMDIDRVGIYGCSAGGQNAMGAVLFHLIFIK